MRLDRYGDPVENEPFDAYATANCGFCDDDGIRLNGLHRCDHIDYASAARRGMDLIREALRKKPK